MFILTFLSIFFRYHHYYLESTHHHISFIKFELYFQEYFIEKYYKNAKCHFKIFNKKNLLIIVQNLFLRIYRYENHS